MAYLNFFGLIFMILIMIPNIIYAIKCKGDFGKLPQTKFWKILEVFEQIGRYGCFACMIFNIPGTCFGFASVNLFSTIGGVAYVAFVVFFKYKWTRTEIGLTFTKQTVKEYWLGAALAFTMLVACIIPGIIWGAAHLSVASINNDVLMKWAIFGLGFVIQSFSEEFLCRGVVFKHLLRRYGIWAATILQALIFMAMHSGNPGMGLIPYVNLFLVGFIFGQVVIITDNLLFVK